MTHPGQVEAGREGAGPHEKSAGVGAGRWTAGGAGRRTTLDSDLVVEGPGGGGVEQDGGAVGAAAQDAHAGGLLLGVVPVPSGPGAVLDPVAHAGAVVEDGDGAHRCVRRGAQGDKKDRVVRPTGTDVAAPRSSRPRERAWGLESIGLGRLVMGVVESSKRSALMMSCPSPYSHSVQPVGHHPRVMATSWVLVRQVSRLLCSSDMLCPISWASTSGEVPWTQA